MISFALHGKDDGYMGNFHWRISTTINWLAEYSSIPQLEIVVCDWGSDPPLRLSLSECAAAVTRVIYVPPELAREKQRDSPFPASIARNVAIRRCKGNYIVALDADMLVTEPFRIDTRAVTVCARRDLPLWFCNRRPSTCNIHNYLDVNLNYLPLTGLGQGYCAPSGLIGMHRRLWYELRGADESMIYHDWHDIDLVLRAAQRYRIRRLHDSVCVHLKHYQKSRKHSDVCEDGRRQNAANDSPEFAANDEHWGLANDNSTGIVELACKPQLHAEYLPCVCTDKSGILSLLSMCGGTSAAITEYAKTFGIRRYMEFGYTSAEFAMQAAYHSPGCELYLVTDWRNMPRYDAPPEASWVFGTDHTLKAFHRGYTHFFTNGCGWHDVVGGREFDLVVVREGHTAPIPCLSDQGIVLSVSGEQFRVIT